MSRSRSETAFLDGGGRMGALMRSHDWSRSPLGEPAGWPDTLKIAVATCLSSRFPMVIWWGPQLLMLYNDAWQPILGETKHPAGLGRPGSESWPETWPIVSAQFESALRGVGSWQEDLLLASDRRGFLEECYFTYSHSPLRDASGAVVGVHTVVTETTAHVLNERRLRVLRDLSKSTVDATNEQKSLPELCHMLVDRLCAENADVSFAIQYLVDQPGLARVVAFCGIDAARFPPEVSETEGDAWGIAEILRGRSDVEIDASSFSEPLPGGTWPEPTRQVVALPLSRSSHDSSLCGVLVIGINSRLRLDAPYMDFLRLVAAQLVNAVSALTVVESERTARAEAERATRLKDEFLATLSHELRNPLNAVAGWVSLLKTDLSDEERVRTAVEVIERNVEAQSRLITDLLDLSRISSGGMRLDLQAVELPGVIDAIVESIAPAAAAKRIHIDKNVDPASKPVVGDPARVEQMLENILVNAVKFTPEGGHVTVSLATGSESARIAVSDDGEGIAPEFLPHVFDRFRQADGSGSRRHGGLGLGLALVKQLAELHGGRVSAASDGRGAGSTFALELPLARERGPEHPLGATRGIANRASAPSSFDGLRVLIIEDQPDALAMLELVLEDCKAAVHTASAAQAALEILSTETFDVIVSDIAMPGLDGYGLILELRRRAISTPVIAVTAFASAEDRAKLFASGFKGHVPKPLERDVLLDTIARVAGRTTLGR